MAANSSNLPATDPAGPVEVNDTYTVNNDYLYPRYTRPPMLEQAYLDRGAETNPYKKIGLLRGYLYPVDVDAAGWAATTAPKAGETPLSASQRARAEAVALYEEARRAAEAATGQNIEDTPPTVYAPAGPSDRPLEQGKDDVSTPKKIRYAQGKQFQFNPISLALTIQMIGIAPPETTQTEGTNSGQMLGQAETSVELYFDRSIEVAAATMSRATVNGHKIDPVFADIGVQKDLWDVYRIILGGDELYYGVGSTLVNIDDAAGTMMQLQPGSGTDMFQRLFDVGASGSKVWARRIALYYNPNLVIIGEVTSIGIIYAEFNANYVPTKAKMDIGISVLSTTSESGADTFNGADDTTVTDPADPDNGTNDDGDGNDETNNSSSETTRTQNGSIVTTTHTTNGHTTTTYHVAGTNIQIAV